MSCSTGQYLIGIDVGGTNLRLALISADGRIHGRIRMESRIDEGRSAFCDRLLHGIAEMKTLADTLDVKISGIGAGIPGLIGHDGVIRSSVNMRPLDGFNPAGFIADQTGITAVCANDANVIALGEYAYGAGRNFESMIVLTLGTGLGSGLILGKRLWTGLDGFASEFGHVTVEPDGYPCTCGNHGCLEQYVSAGAIVREAGRHMNTIPAIIDAAAVAKLAQTGNNAALAAFEQAGIRLGQALASLVNTLNIELVILCGGVSGSLDLILPALKQELGRRCFQEMQQRLKITGGSLGDDAGLLGAVHLALSAASQPPRYSS